MNFGDFIRERRIKMKLTLRQFAKQKGYDAAYISRLENNLVNPPTDEEKLRGLAKALELKEQSEEWVQFFDLAAASRGQIPQDLASNINILPAFYRTIRKKKITEEDIKDLVKIFKKGQK